MIVRPATADDIRRVTLNVCPADAAMLFARRFDDDRHALADELIAMQPRAIATLAFAAADGAPAESLLNATLISPGVAAMYWFSTAPGFGFSYDDSLLWLRIWRDEVEPMLRATVHRAQTSILDSNRAQKRRLARIGFVCEGLEHMAGRNGEDIARYAWLNPERLTAGRRG